MYLMSVSVTGFVILLCVAAFITIGGIYRSRWTVAMIAFTVVLVCLVSLVILLRGTA